MASDERPPSGPPALPVEGVPLVYINWLRTVGTAGDFAIDVGYQGGNEPPVPSVRLAMTWEHAKLLYESLGGAIEKFQEQGESIRDLKKHLIAGPNDPSVQAEDSQQGGSGR